ncbi:MAG: hypothetical protein ISR65_07510 [Bacteriovoracaceae bacterium]|nr:hypothetical protein [Bacteriovoracaceae bacterium]
MRSADGADSHSAMSVGNDLSCAGEKIVEVVSGKKVISKLNNKSGGYRPHPGCLVATFQYLTNNILGFARSLKGIYDEAEQTNLLDAISFI